MTQDTEDFILSWVGHDARPLTVRLLSRTRNLHLDQAKAALAQFFEAHKNEVHATFLLKGLTSVPAPVAPPPLPSQAKRPRTDEDDDNAQESEGEPMDVDAPSSASTSRETMLLLLVSSANRQAAQERFTHLDTNEIYSLHPGTHANSLADKAQLIEAAQEGVQGSALAHWDAADRGGKLGAINNPEIKDLLSPTERAEHDMRQRELEAKSRAKSEEKPKIQSRTMATTGRTPHQKTAGGTNASTAAEHPLQPVASESTPQGPAGPAKRGKRKVIKRQKTKNAKGYTVVQNVEVWESCSEPEDQEVAPAPPAARTSAHKSDTTKPASAPPGAGKEVQREEDSDSARPPPHPHPPAKKTYSGPPKKAQQSLSSFFGKKK